MRRMISHTQGRNPTVREGAEKAETRPSGRRAEKAETRPSGRVQKRQKPDRQGGVQKGQKPDRQGACRKARVQKKSTLPDGRVSVVLMTSTRGPRRSDRLFRR